MKRVHFFLSILFLSMLSTVYSTGYSQGIVELKGRWEGIHYYGDTTRLFDGTMVVRASTIDSMRMVLVINESQEGKFTGKLHEHFYSDPQRIYFTADVTGFVKDETIHFDSFAIKENKMPKGNRWCKPKATGVMVKKDDVFMLNMSFESTLTCTIGPAILERKAAEVIPPPVVEIPKKDTAVAKVDTPRSGNPPKPDLTTIAEKFRMRNRSVKSTISVESDSITIHFVDNGTVDGDSISVFINGELKSPHVRLTASPFTMKVQFENGITEIEVAMFAENLGTFPPNTALMQIVDGKKIHQAHLSSDTRSNAVIRIKKKE